MKMKNINFTIVVALLIAGVAAFFSITGLSKLFAGALIPVIIMGSILEIGKLRAASHLQRHWSRLGKAMRVYLSIGVVVLMLITSVGIYGFLTDAYQKTAHKYDNIQKQTELIDKKENLVKDQIKRNEGLISTRTEREKSLTTLRTNQESRLDTLLNRNRSTSAKSAQGSINDANEEIKQINIDISKYNADINVLNDSVGVYENQKLQLSNSNDVAEIGPLKYIATLTGKPMDVVVNWVILALIFVFDPMAIILLISGQSTHALEELERIENEKKKFEFPIADAKEGQVLVADGSGNIKFENSQEEEFVEHEPENETAIDTPEVFEEELIPVNETLPPTPGFTTISPTGYTMPISFSTGETETTIIEPVSEAETVVDESTKKDEEFDKYYNDQLESINKYETKFNDLINILYNNGTIRAGENLLNYLEFKDRVEAKFGKRFLVDDIKKFLTICNYLKITSLSKGERKSLLDFDSAKKELKKYFDE